MPVNAISPKFMKVKTTIGSTTTDRSFEVKSIKWTADDAGNDALTLGSAAADSKDHTCEIEFLQDMDAGSLWSYTMDHAGETVTVEYLPFGNEAASVGQPHWTADCVVGFFDGDYLGGGASTSNTAKLSSTVKWSSTKPVRVTT